jgi:hypothetical protein
MRAMIEIWFGRLAWSAAVRSGKVEVIGPRQLCESLGSWFLLSPIAAEGNAAPRIGATMPTQVGTGAARQPVGLHQQ